jgi:serine/threonine protein kinase
MSALFLLSVEREVMNKHKDENIEDETNKQITSHYGDEKKSTEQTGYSKNETFTYQDSKSKDKAAGSPNLIPGSNVELRGNSYKIIEVLSLGVTTEADIYMVSNDIGEVYSLKLYHEHAEGYSFREPNFNTLSRISKISDKDILRLHFFGVGAEKFLSRYCYEICDLAEGGDLLTHLKSNGELSYDFILNHLVPQVLSGIRKLHDNKIFHCDLKPSNIFFRDKAKTDIVIGDYGSAKAYDLELQKDVNKSSTVIGTNYYMAPEQPRGFISEKIDYYAMGIILLQLLYPKELSKDGDNSSIDKQKFETISERQYNQQPVLHTFKSEYDRVNKLIEGFTLFNPQNRWGKREVVKWLRLEDSEIKYGSGISEYSTIVKLGYATIRTEKDLIRVLETVHTWYEDLFEDIDTYTTLKNWLDSFLDIPSRKVIDNMIRHYQPMGKEYVQEAIIRYFQPERDIVVMSHHINFYNCDDILIETERFFSILDDVWKSGNQNAIFFFIFQLEFSLRQLSGIIEGKSKLIVSSVIEKIFSIFGIIQKPFDDFRTEIATKFKSGIERDNLRLFLSLFYSFNKNREFRDLKNNSIDNLEEIALFFLKNESLYDDKYLALEREFYLKKQNRSYLAGLTFKQFIFEVYKDNAEAQVDLEGITLKKKGMYEVKYKYFKTLKEYINSLNLPFDPSTKSEATEIYFGKREFLNTFASEFKKFIDDVKREHSIETLTDNNIDKLKKQFISHSRKCFAKLYSGQIIAFIIALPLTFFIYALASQQLHIDKNLRFYWMNEGEYQRVLQTTELKTFLKTLSINQVKVFPSGEIAPEQDLISHYKRFKSNIAKYITLGATLYHPQLSNGESLVINYKIAKNGDLFTDGSFQSYVKPNLEASVHFVVLKVSNRNYWPKGKYVVTITAGENATRTESFEII